MGYSLRVGLGLDLKVRVEVYMIRDRITSTLKCGGAWAGNDESRIASQPKCG